MFNEQDVIYLSEDYQYYISMAVHDHILNSILTVFILAFVAGHGFGFMSREILEYAKRHFKGQE